MRLNKNNFYDNNDYEKMPILFCIFSKTETTMKVFNAIKKSKPKKLYISSDGWRENKVGEKENVESLRKAVLESIDWDCEVFTKFSDKNLGCKQAIESAVDWFFENEEMGIILEDDTLPAHGFFRFCSEMLIKYKDDEKLWIVKGHNEHAKKLSANSYYFKDNVGMSEMWGWATWRRAWEKHDKTAAQFEEYAKMCDNYEDGQDFDEYINYTRMLFILAQVKAILNGKINSWSYLLKFSVAVNNGFFILPDCNLVSNIGCAAQGAAHTGTEYYLEGTLPIGEMLFPLRHPENLSSRPLTAREYVRTAKPKDFQEEFEDLEIYALNDFFAVQNFLKQNALFNEPKIAEKFKDFEKDRLCLLIKQACCFNDYHKAQKYLYLALTKLALVDEKNFCSKCQSRDCLSVCPTKSISLVRLINREKAVKIDPKTCANCWNCVKHCPFVRER
ncbi:MAG: 4Fe-4S dicluster domain-containing protein [Chitinivibrionia bacterium]|nr:4Fe-4S dicluster domain-containing protein [Chitinivibrionia bacterium]